MGTSRRITGICLLGLARPQERHERLGENSRPETHRPRSLGTARPGDGQVLPPEAIRAPDGTDPPLKTLDGKLDRRGAPARKLASKETLLPASLGGGAGSERVPEAHPHPHPLWSVPPSCEAVWSATTVTLETPRLRGRTTSFRPDEQNTSSVFQQEPLLRGSGWRRGIGRVTQASVSTPSLGSHQAIK